MWYIADWERERRDDRATLRQAHRDIAAVREHVAHLRQRVEYIARVMQRIDGGET